MYPVAREGDPITHDMLVPCGVIGPPTAGPCLEPVLIHGMPAARWLPSLDMGGCGVFLGDLALGTARTVVIGS